MTPMTSWATVPTTISESAVEILHQIASSVATSARPIQTAARNQVFSMRRLRPAVVRVQIIAEDAGGAGDDLEGGRAGGGLGRRHRRRGPVLVAADEAVEPTSDGGPLRERVVEQAAPVIPPPSVGSIQVCQLQSPHAARSRRRVSTSVTCS